MKKVLFLHGWMSDGGTKTMFLRSLGYDVVTPRLSDWSFTGAVQTAQAAFNAFCPDVIVGSSRGGAVAMNLDSGETPLILLAPAWKVWGTARSLNKNCIVIHSPHDEFIPLSASTELCDRSRATLVIAGKDHRLNCDEGQRALKDALQQV
jgi:hypothetical protein